MALIRSLSKLVCRSVIKGWSSITRKKFHNTLPINRIKSKNNKLSIIKIFSASNLKDMTTPTNLGTWSEFFQALPENDQTNPKLSHLYGGSGLLEYDTGHEECCSDGFGAG